MSKAGGEIQRPHEHTRRDTGIIARVSSSFSFQSLACQHTNPNTCVAGWLGRCRNVAACLKNVRCGLCCQRCCISFVLLPPPKHTHSLNVSWHLVDVHPIQYMSSKTPHLCQHTLRICMMSPMRRADAALLLAAAAALLPAAAAPPPAAAAILLLIATRSCRVRFLRSAAYSSD